VQDLLLSAKHLFVAANGSPAGRINDEQQHRFSPDTGFGFNPNGARGGSLALRSRAFKALAYQWRLFLGARD
jgi:hypothetical protein